MRLLVISSCTGRKRFKSDEQLSQDDFRDPERLRRRETELACYTCRAAEMYEGEQHKGVMEGLAVLRKAGVSAELQILSAGYGLIPADRPIAPYDVTFATMGPAALRHWADTLRIPEAVRAAIRPYPLVIFLLGQKYLSAARPPIPAAEGQRLLFFAPSGEERVTGPGAVRVPADLELCGRYRSGNVALKGAMFAALARGIASDKDRWLTALLEDATGEVAQDILSIGLEGEGEKHVEV
jgi:hypothetical protein